MLEGNYERKIGLEEVWIVDWFRLEFRVYTICLRESFIKEQNHTKQSDNTKIQYGLQYNIQHQHNFNSRGKKKVYKCVMYLVKTVINCVFILYLILEMR